MTQTRSVVTKVIRRRTPIFLVCFHSRPKTKKENDQKENDEKENDQVVQVDFGNKVPCNISLNALWTEVLVAWSEATAMSR